MGKCVFCGGSGKFQPQATLVEVLDFRNEPGIHSELNIWYKFAVSSPVGPYIRVVRKDRFWTKPVPAHSWTPER